MTERGYLVGLLVSGTILVAAAWMHDHGHPRFAPLVFIAAGAFLVCFALIAAA